MKKKNATLENVLKAGEAFCGFEVEKVTPVPSIRAVAYQMRHKKSGARVLHLHADDSENLFAIAFKTPPLSDDGRPHILEHSVLGGSKSYPVKDPFVELVKSSLATFINAITYSDRTVYPVSTMNRRDFFNLARVYCDCVFFPILGRDCFMREGHHLAFSKPGDISSDLIVQGIVYNEMKGAFSGLDGIMSRAIDRSIFPDNAYGLESGGIPEAIQKLTYEEFQDFYAKYYHPSNSLILIYGDIPTRKHLEFLDGEFLSKFECLEINTEIAVQPRWNEPRYQTIPYPIGENEDAAKKAAVVLTFFANDTVNAVQTLAMLILEEYLLGNAAAPLKKALIDSKLGQDLTPSGYAMWQRDAYFTVGLRGTEAEHAQKIVELTMATCRNLVEGGFDKDKLNSAVFSLRLQLSEIGSNYPVSLMQRVYLSWPYGHDPLYYLDIDRYLTDLVERINSETGFLESILEEMIVKNNHYSVLTFVPDKGYMRRQENEFAAKMEEIKAGMSIGELERVAEEAAALEASQSAPNSPEALATLPKLSLSDIHSKPHELNTVRENVAGRPFLFTDVYSNSINYLDIAFDLQGIDEDLIDYLSLYTSVLRKMGAGDDDYVKMAEREAAATGGIETNLSFEGNVKDPFCVQPFLVVGANSFHEKIGDMMRVLFDRIAKCDLTDMDRMKDVILQKQAAHESDLLHSGHQYALRYANRNSSCNLALVERVDGISQTRFLKELVVRFEARQGELVSKLARIKHFILSKDRLVASFVGAETQCLTARAGLSDFISGLRNEKVVDKQFAFVPDEDRQTAIVVPAGVAFVASAFPIKNARPEDMAALSLIGRILQYGYLWEQIRVVGSAYGARASYGKTNGAFGFTSYRDPHIKRTLEIYDKAFDYILREMDLNPGALEQLIIGAFGGIDAPIRPRKAVGLALGHYLSKSDKQFRRNFRQNLLSLNGDNIRRVVAEILKPAYAQTSVCVLAGKEKIVTENEKLPDGRKLHVVDI